ILLGPNQQMPMVGQDHVSQQAHRRTLPGLSQYLLEGRVVARLVEQRGTSDRPVEEVVHITRIRASSPSRHTAESNNATQICQETLPMISFECPASFCDPTRGRLSSWHQFPPHPRPIWSGISAGRVVTVYGPAARPRPPLDALGRDEVQGRFGVSLR